MADDLIEAGDSELSNAIIKAQQTLKGAFPVELAGKGSYRFLKLENLIESYSIESRELGVVTKNFIELANSIKKMRSSYLPIEFYKDEFGTLQASMADTVSEKESYENAFMRMLGMPSTSDSRLASANYLLYIEPTGKISKTSIEDVERLILDQRNQERGLRGVVINNSIYNLNNLPAEFISLIEEGEDSLDLNAIAAGDYTSSIEDEETVSQEARISNIEDDFFKFSYLLLPAIQDDRVSGCINETAKIVASPFSAVRGRVVNEGSIRPTLLESIIRIRLDRLSGTNGFFELDDPVPSGGISLEASMGEEKTIPVNSNAYGMLESLFILRLRAAIGGLARAMADNIEDFITSSESIRLIPENHSSSAQHKASGGDKDADDLADNSRPSAKSNEGTDVGTNKEILENQLLIEDAIMSLLGDTGEALDLQLQTQRNSSIHDAHLMSGLLSVVDIPRSRIQKELNEREETRNSRIDVEGGENTASINTVLGVANGVGTIDIAVFSLALFTMTESGLVGLLSEQDYLNLLKNNYADLPTDAIIRDDLIDSINQFSSLVIAGYKLFQKELSTQDQTPMD
jgi:hypothetical protein